MPAVIQDKEDSDLSSEDEQEDHPCIAWSGLSRKIPVLVFHAETVVSKGGEFRDIGERYNLAFKIVRTESRLVRSILSSHGFHEVHPNSNDFNLMWTGIHLKPYLLRGLQDFQKVNHFPRSYELTRKDRLYKNIQRMQQVHGFKRFHIIPQSFILPSEYQEFCSSCAKDKGPWIIKPVASSRGRGIYLVSSPNQIPMDENILVSRYINNPLLIDDFKFDVRLYVLVTSYEPLIIYLYEEGLARFATVKYDHAAKNIKNQFMHLTNYSVNKKSSDYVSCDDPEVEDYGNKWSMSAMLRYLKQEGKDTALLMGQVEDLVIKAVLSAEQQIATACKMYVPHRNNCFELYGFDVLIDSNLKPWLLEVNLSPSLACDAPLDLKIKASMISDMFSLVGFVCQDPLLRQTRPGRYALDPSSRFQTYKPQRQRPVSASDVDPSGTKDKVAGKDGDSTLGLTAEELKVLRKIKEENERRGGFIRIFPTPETWELYSGYLEYKTSMNCMLATRLFPERSGKSSVSLKLRNGSSSNGFQALHLARYERKLPSLEARKRRRLQAAQRSAVRKKKGGGRPETSITEITSEEDSEELEEEEEKSGSLPLSIRRMAQVNACAAAPHKQAPQEITPRRSPSPSPLKPRVNLLQMLQQGWNLSKVQARMAFSSYLHRVQMRLLAESRGNGSSAWPERDDDQMELVVRFLKRAASNLQQDLRVALPSRRLPLADRRRILSHQLGEFIHCYNKETEQMVKKMERLAEEERCVNPDVFQEFVEEASESDLEEVLTFYTHKNKSASVFLGTGCTNAKSGVASSGRTSQRTVEGTSRQASGDAQQAMGECSALDPSLSTIRPATPELLTLSSQHSMGYPTALDYAHIQLQHCPLPGPPGLQQSGNVTACLGPATVPAPPAPEPLRPVHTCFTPPASTAVSSVPSAVQIYSQKLSRPTSFRQAPRKASLGKARPGSAGISKDPDPAVVPPLITPPVSPNQQAVVAALQRLAEKQATRQYSASSHINLLTQHLTNLNLANGAFVRGGFSLTSAFRHGTTNERPIRAVLSESRLASSTRVRPEDDSLRDGETRASYGQIMGPAPPQHHQFASGSYQLQFAIQQLQQQKAQSRQLLDQSRARHQAILASQMTVQAPSHSPGSVALPRGPQTGVPPQQSQTQSPSAFVLAPRPPRSIRDGLVRKTSTQRLNRQTPPETHANGVGPSTQHVVYEAVCAKAGLSVYSRLFQSPTSSR
ncbi:tubulin polyglutamylase TTLL5 [Scleropages formosus]|uniref:Tubulin--tyrosine ligase-like protein 5 n=1 Tax=Scleropages formosus TaxID=113540 RepID=A0A8C9STL2_SCLFO|nr:tubulin polyglutamylase TTLL5 [Scleropages formosus]XP_029114146.1 tubulin polyglutamylase TTLL5 [Scleropages formosus]